MDDSRSPRSPQVLARIAGILYLFIIFAGGYVEIFIRGKIIVSGNAAATAHNIVSYEQLWRYGFTAEAVMWIFSVVTMTAFYVLLKPVNPTIALMALIFNIVDTVVETLNATLCNFAALFLAGSNAQFGAMALRLHEYGFGAGLLFFAFWLILTGYLIVRSGYFPAWLGVLAAIGGTCYAINSLALFAAPDIADAMFPYILLPSLVAELSLAIWLTIKGVNLDQWRLRTSA